MIGLVGATIGSFAMMLYASTHFAGVAGPGNTPPALSAAPLVSGTSDQDRIVSAVKRVSPSVVAINVNVDGRQYIPVDPFQQFFGGGAQGNAKPYPSALIAMTRDHRPSQLPQPVESP